MWWLRPAGGLLLGVIGVVWFLQGIGIARGSPMTGQPVWSVAGTILIAVGVALIVRRPRRRSP